MNFDEAIQAHSAWKVKLAVYVRKPDGALRSNEVRAPNRCALGKWLEGSGMKYASLPEYKTLVAEHAQFHVSAASVIEKADSGAKLEQDATLGADSHFGIASRNVVKAIMDLRKKATVE
jgi:methyl-accepting chemotaxis protein